MIFTIQMGMCGPHILNYLLIYIWYTQVVMFVRAFPFLFSEPFYCTQHFLEHSYQAEFSFHPFLLVSVPSGISDINFQAARDR